MLEPLRLVPQMLEPQMLEPQKPGLVTLGR